METLSSVDVVERFMAMAAGADLKTFADDEAWEAGRGALEELVAHDCVFAWVAPGVRTERIGVAGLREGWLEFMEPFESYVTTIEEVRGLDDERVLVLVVQTGRLATGHEIDIKAAGIARVSGGKLVAMDFNASREEVLE